MSTPTDAPAKFLADRRGPQITEPGVYTMNPEDYHRDPVPGGSLSSTGARRLLPPGCPAHFDYERRHGRKATSAMELGTAAHSMVLGIGPEIDVIDAPDRRTKRVKERETDARAEGMIPMLQWEYEQVLAMAAAIKAHPVAGALFDPNRGVAEQSLFWRSGGIWRRARPDWMHRTATGALILVDYKSCTAADTASLSKAMHDRGYHQQDDWYTSGATALGLGGGLPVKFVFLFQETRPPFLVRFMQTRPDALRIARARNEEAAALYAACSASGRWPGYSDDIDPLPLPAWVMNNHHRERR